MHNSNNITGKIFLSPGRGLQKYRVLGEDRDAVAVEIEGRTGFKMVTTFSKYHFQSLLAERARQDEGAR
jgi:hypothetical protein